MKSYCIVGAGAIGCAMAGRLAAAGRQVTLVARGAKAAVLRTEGLLLAEDGDACRSFPAIAEDPAALGVQDVLILAVKAQALPGLLPGLAPLIGPDTLVLPMVNGIPWWYFQGIAANGDGIVRAVDPDGSLQALLPAASIAGCVVFTTSSLAGVNEVTVGNRQSLILGPLCAQASATVAALAADLDDAGIEARLSDDIRKDLWTKVALNLSTNPLSVVTEATLEQEVTDPCLLPVVTQILDECLEVAARYGVSPTLTRDEMLQRPRQAGAHRTSMLKDYLGGRALELSSIYDAVAELAARVSVDMPVSHTIASMARYRAKTLAA